jgi:hypothetical protein
MGYHGITFVTMASQQTLLDRIEGLRAKRNNVHGRELFPIALAVGRVESRRGKHRVFEKLGRPPLPIPDHPRAMAGRTVLSILQILEEDIRSDPGRWTD